MGSLHQKKKFLIKEPNVHMSFVGEWNAWVQAFERMIFLWKIVGKCVCGIDSNILISERMKEREREQKKKNAMKKKVW